MRRRGTDSAGLARAVGGTSAEDTGDAIGHPLSGTARGRWLTRGKDGRLTLHAPSDDGLLRWTERRPGGPEWTGPDFFPAAHLTDHVIAQGADGIVHLFARRPRADDPGVEIVHAIQYQSGRPVTEWRSLGNPYRTAENGRKAGVPTAAVDTRGTVFVFLRNAGRGLQLRREQKNGTWGRWEDLRGSRLGDGPVPAATSDGHVEVAVPSDQGVRHWVQDVPDGALSPVDAPQECAALAGSGTALETGPGRLTYYWTDPDSASVVAHRRGGPALPLGGSPGDGALAALRARVDGQDCTVLAQRGAAGTLLLGVCATEAEEHGMWWSDTGVACTGDPALALDALGRVVVAIRGADGAPRLTRQDPDGPGLTLSPDWRRL
ncbi:hypothetical protein [Streptomyces sp. NPDC050145]|uniref:hypothetical protein n=1 Tax=Streptomyces sp. NPDC050145 TaxID=3365602 RepID=UPI003797B2D0